MTKLAEYAILPQPKSALWNSGFRIIALLRGTPLKRSDLRLRFMTWQAASDYLDDLERSGVIDGGRIDQYVKGIGWVLRDTDPEADNAD